MKRSPMRNCGRRYATRDDALASRRGRTGLFDAVGCQDRECSGYHLRLRVKAAPAKRKTPRDTGPAPAVRALVLARDSYACVRCCKPCGPGIAPYSLQHRKRRSQGGPSLPSNLVVLCGTATSPDCHWICDRRLDPLDEERGYTVRSNQDPRLVGVMYFGRPGESGQARWLDDGGGVLFEPPEGAERVA